MFARSGPAGADAIDATISAYAPGRPGAPRTMGTWPGRRTDHVDVGARRRGRRRLTGAPHSHRGRVRSIAVHARASGSGARWPCGRGQSRLEDEVRAAAHWRSSKSNPRRESPRPCRVLGQAVGVESRRPSGAPRECRCAELGQRSVPMLPARRWPRVLISSRGVRRRSPSASAANLAGRSVHLRANDQEDQRSALAMTFLHVPGSRSGGSMRISSDARRHSSRAEQPGQQERLPFGQRT